MELNHVRAGSGEPLVLLHGIGSSHRAWEPVMQALAAEHQVVAVDLPGFGASEPLPPCARPDLAAMVDASARFLEGAGLSGAHVAGNSMGGWIALELGRRGLARSVVAVSPAGFWTRREAAYARSTLRLSYALSRALAPAAPRLLASAAGRTAVMGQVVARPWLMSPELAVHAIRNLAASTGFVELLENMTAVQYRLGAPVTCPVTIAWGTRDRLLWPRQARRAGRVLPGSRVIPLPGLGHVPMSDAPDIVAGTLLEGISAPSPAH